MTQESSSINYLSLDEIGPSGLIFVRSTSLIDHVVTAITKQEFADLGIYYQSKGVHYAILVQPLANNWFKRVPLISLINSGTMMAIGIKKLLTGREEFSLAVVNLLAQQGAANPRGYLRQLVGITETNPIPCSGVEMVNQIINAMGRSHLFSTNNTISTKILDELNQPLSEDNPGRLIQYLWSNVNQAVANQQMQSYLLTDGMFGSICYLDIKPAKGLDYSTQPQLSQLIDLGLQMIVDDPDFYQALVRGANEGRTCANNLNGMLAAALSELSQSQVESLQYILSCLAKGTIQLDRLEVLASDVNQDADRVAKVTGKDHGLRIKIPTLAKDLKILARRHRSNADQAIKELHRITSNLVEQALTSNQANLNINQLIQVTNQLGQSLDLSPIEVLPPNSSYSIIAKTSSSAPNPELRLSLDSGRQVTLACYGADLSIFDRDELLEILEALDNSNQPQFDQLRVRITDLLAQ